MLNTNNRMHKQNRTVNNRYCLSLGANTAASRLLFSLCLFAVCIDILPTECIPAYANFSTVTTISLWTEFA